MDLKNKIQILTELGYHLTQNPPKLEQAMRDSKLNNPWFTLENCKLAVDQIINNFLNEDKLFSWFDKYKTGTNNYKKIGLILAGNIPLVGLHDVISCFLTGNISQIKLSDKDKFLLPYFVDVLKEINPESSKYFEFVERLDAPDAVIATGSNSSARYFVRYFGKYPHIIRKNRNAISILSGTETKDELSLLAKDVFSYFGLGCRNVSKVYFPQDYDIPVLMETLHDFNDIILHNKYKNNYDFNYAIYLLNKENFFMNGAIILREHSDIISRIACLHFEYYEKLEILENELFEKQDQIQCISTSLNLKSLPFVPMGMAQSPALDDYADGVDTVEFLLNLK